MSDSPLPQNRPLQESDLSALIATGARENRFLEFKREYLPETPNGKKKFLQAVAAFANSRGGDLILGMAETDGVASAMVPLQGLDPDQCRLQILDLIRVHFRPPLGGVQIHAVSLGAGGYVIVVRVPKTWAGPHMLDDEHCFYIRDDGKKRPMDYEDVREGYLAVLSELEVPLPYALFLTLLNVRGYFMTQDPMFFDGQLISRDHLYVPEAVFNSALDSVPAAMFPVFNSVWNACGIAQSRNYDADGNWKPKR